MHGWLDSDVDFCDFEGIFRVRNTIFSDLDGFFISHITGSNLCTTGCTISANFWDLDSLLINSEWHVLILWPVVNFQNSHLRNSEINAMSKLHQHYNFRAHFWDLIQLSISFLDISWTYFAGILVHYFEIFSFWHFELQFLGFWVWLHMWFQFWTFL